MRHEDELLLDRAVGVLKSDVPDAAKVAASAGRVGERLGIHAMGVAVLDEIKGCEDVRRSLGAYRTGTLNDARSVLIEAHLRECGACLRESKSADGRAVLDWSLPGVAKSGAENRGGWHGFRTPAFGWVLAPACVLLVSMFFVYRAYWQVPPGVRAEVESIDGPAYRIAGDGRPLAAGDHLGDGEQLRTSGGGHAVLRLSDGSTVEINERSVLGVGARGHDMTVSLDSGAMIVQAAKREVGHLFVKTPDCRVAVTGTVFSVNSGIKGSQVAVLQGSVHVEHAGIDRTVDAGGQLFTDNALNTAPGKEPIAEQIAWSHDRERYLPLLAQFAVLEHKIAALQLPQARYSSDLLGRVPADTLLYVSIPNLGDLLVQAKQIFDDQLKQSPELQQWWNSNQHGRRDGGQGNSADLDALVDRLHQMSQYFGEEVVVVAMGGGKGGKTGERAGDGRFAVVTDLRKDGLADFLKQQMATMGAGPGAGLTVLDENALSAASISSKDERGLYALVRQHEAVFSNSVASLKEVDMQLDAGASGFADGDFGKQITAAYGRGAGVILAADLHQMVASREMHGGRDLSQNNLIESSGMDGVRYLIAEHREMGGEPQNRLNLQFTGTRQRVASWLAAPAAMGSLEFVTPNASIAVAVLSKDPKAIADDIMDMTTPDKGQQQKDWNDADTKLQVNLRDDLAANLGGEFLVSLDGPVLPMPAWKAVIEVHDSVRLEKTLEQIAQAVSAQMQSAGGSGKNAHPVAIDVSDVGSQRFYAVRDVKSGNAVANYTFADGYMIVAPSRALLIEAIKAHTDGDSLARSAAFKASLPKDENENYSAVAYQNLSPVITPLLSQLSGETADTLRKLASDARPTTVCAWGRDSRIEAASDSKLFGFDFLALGALIHKGPNGLGNSMVD